MLGPYARYPLAEERAYTAPEAPLPVFLDMLRTMGLERAVIAHVSAHGTDLRVTLDAIREMGTTARGTIMLTPAITDSDLKEFHAQGIRGIRLAHAFGYDVTRRYVAATRRAESPTLAGISPFGPEASTN